MVVGLADLVIGYLKGNLTSILKLVDWNMNMLNKVKIWYSNDVMFSAQKFSNLIAKIRFHAKVLELHIVTSKYGMNHKMISTSLPLRSNIN